MFRRGLGVFLRGRVAVLRAPDLRVRVRPIARGGFGWAQVTHRPETSYNE